MKVAKTDSPKPTATAKGKTQPVLKIKASAPAKPESDKSSEHRENLNKIFIDTIKDMYWAEKHLSKALPKMAKAAGSQDLKAGFTEHLEQTKGHISRLEKCFEVIGKKAQAKKCEAMEGLVKEGEEAIEEYKQGPGRDAALIVAAQKVEHYEISGYGSLHAFAGLLGYTEAADLLAQTLQEEKDTDVKLSDLSDNINQAALAA